MTKRFPRMIVVEGYECVGKTSFIKELAKRIAEENPSATIHTLHGIRGFKEGARVWSAIEKITIPDMENRETMLQVAQALSEVHLAGVKVIDSLLADNPNSYVIMDRWIHSFLVYQLKLERLPVDESVVTRLKQAIDSFKHTTVFLNDSWLRVHARIGKRDGKKIFYDAAKIEFIRRGIAEYREVMHDIYGAAFPITLNTDGVVHVTTPVVITNPVTGNRLVEIDGYVCIVTQKPHRLDAIFDDVKEEVVD